MTAQAPGAPYRVSFSASFSRASPDQCGQWIDRTTERLPDNAGMRYPNAPSYRPAVRLLNATLFTDLGSSGL